MAYQITYYADRAMLRPMPDTDQLSDAAFARYPAPTGNETAFARHSDNPELNRYGYDGKWHDCAPREALIADGAPHIVELVKAYSRPHNPWFRTNDGRLLDLQTLRQWAAQDASGVYGRLLDEAKALAGES